MRTKKSLFVCVVLSLVLLAPVFGGGQQEGVPGVTEDTIRVGSTMALSGPVAAIGGPMAEGLRAWIAHVNNAGGIHGRQIDLRIQDDQFNPANTASLTRRLVERDRVFAMVGSLGTPCVLAIMDYLNDRGVPFVYQGAGATQLAVPPKQYVFPFQPNYLLEGNVMATYMVEELGLTRLGMVYRNADDGQDAYNSARETIEKAYPNAKLVEAISVDPYSSDFSTAIRRLQAADVEGIMLVTFNPQTPAFLQQAYEFGLTDPVILGSYANADASVVAAAGPDAGEGFQVMAWVAADLTDPDFPPWKIYQDFVGRADAIPNAFAVAGMIAGELFTEGLERAGRDLTREALVEAMESMDNWQGQLVPGATYHPFGDGTDVTSRLGIQAMYVLEVQNGGLAPVSQWIQYRDLD
ncbi:hypothetical protein AU468_05230 [Alkalispirochaeta sphaeroplastigenens]|uniref:Leucine-binding protein domain-containing protein n=1 Tax=Alkalispirochaeta sphaeroplastigenens TaxID=1187066 RepID=A0A2S4JVM7_9SPIO|nr:MULTISPECIES: ABC transporter substrate-binding protein [Alkalispirochaeta]POR03564.1 hypothetical protein AU468_05230 [Alkalispirochaeta sphaeroplastigenens]